MSAQNLVNVHPNELGKFNTKLFSYDPIPSEFPLSNYRRYYIACSPSSLTEKDFLVQAQELRKRKIVFWGFTAGTPLLAMLLTRNTYFIVIPTIFGYYLGNRISQSSIFNKTSPNFDLIVKKQSLQSFLSHFVIANGIPYIEDTTKHSKISGPLNFDERYHLIEKRRYK